MRISSTSSWGRIILSQRTLRSRSGAIGDGWVVETIEIRRAVTVTVTQASALNQCTLVVVSTLLAYNIDFPTVSSGSLNLWISVRLTLEPPRVLASSMGKRSLVQCGTPCLLRYPLSGFESAVVYLMDVKMPDCRVQRFNDSLKQVFTVVSLKAWASFETSPDAQNLGSEI